MNSTQLNRALKVSVAAARAVGLLMSRNLNNAKSINSQSLHDIKLELDVRSQRLITKMLAAEFPDIALLGEEETIGDPTQEYRWVVDPIDGTVNFTYGIPHACVSIALQERRKKLSRVLKKGEKPHPDDSYHTILGVVYDPFCNELWTAIEGKPSRLNNKITRVSNRKKLSDSIVAMGFAKYEVTLNRMLPVFNLLVHRVLKIRLLGAAALSMTWVASGRLDAYKEYGLRLWDIAAAGLIIKNAGGEFYYRPIEGEHTYELVANNGFIRKEIEKLTKL
ncbi:MAG: inositol monophosphatase [Verrucomicrobiales bacterium]|nr:inositol monophosphatase [Verrucomicrobiales bacterium]MDB6129385.1 inositol monophosphatase [Verrucomicrobiales bacterium]